jgi:hypothetical protein
LSNCVGNLSYLLEVLSGMGQRLEESGGLTDFYTAKCRELDVTIATRERNLRRLEAQRNELNGRVRVRNNEEGYRKKSFFFFFSPFCSENVIVWGLECMLLLLTVY